MKIIHAVGYLIPKHAKDILSKVFLFVVEHEFQTFYLLSTILKKVMLKFKFLVGINRVL